MSIAGSVCPVVGSTSSVLPLTHPDVDLDKPDQVCPVTNASTNHHHNLTKHPSVPMSNEQSVDASDCPALQSIVNEPQNQKLDEKVCPVVGAVTTVLPPDHPSTANAKEGDVCPKTNATFAHHKGKVHEHPQVESAPAGAVCPVVGATA